MIEFYQDMVVYHEEEMRRKEEEASIERIKIKLNSFKDKNSNIFIKKSLFLAYTSIEAKDF